jgi:hypothetical protein
MCDLILKKADEVGLANGMEVHSIRVIVFNRFMS